MQLKIYQEVKVQCQPFLTLALNQGEVNIMPQLVYPLGKAPVWSA